MTRLLLLLLVCASATAGAQSKTEIERWQAQARNVEIIEDEWGIPHIYGKTDADAVFGLMYVQCQQNFSRLERNYLEIMGRLSEVEGEQKLFEDLQMRLIYDSAAAKKDYAQAPAWLKKLLDAFADGINYYLYKNPGTRPIVLKKFEPWFPLMYTDGSIAPTQTGGLRVADLKRLYSEENTLAAAPPDPDRNPSGSNGFAIAPKKSASGKAMLYINPHVTFYFRTEVHLVSEEGLNAYGAVTWGQFFIYQGFNEYCGWMHTSSYADVADVYVEDVHRRGDSLHYRYDDRMKPITKKQVTVHYKNGEATASRVFTTYYSHHGPVLGLREGKWLSLKENNRSMASLMQSWLRTKAKGLPEFRKVMDMKINNSNNTVFADKYGNIAYWHGNFMPRRNPAYNWSLPVDGTTPATEWKGLHPVSETVHLINPESGWIQNCNSTPFTAAGKSSPRKSAYPAYMAPDGQNARALNAIRLLDGSGKLSLEDLIHVGYNTRLMAFDFLLPNLVASYHALTDTDTLKKILRQPIHLLEKWDRHTSASSIASTLAIEWAYKLMEKIPPARTTEENTNMVAQYAAMAAVDNRIQLQLLAAVVGELVKNWGYWQVSWGDLNRYQRTDRGKFDDAEASMPVGLGPGTWGSLPSYIGRYYGTKKRYGVSGNSFIAAVEFGDRVKAKTIMTGGESFDPQSPHYLDQASGFLEGKFKDIHYYREDVLKHKVHSYKPGL